MQKKDIIETRIDKDIKLIKQHKDCNFIILINQFDPDSGGAALAKKALIKNVLGEEAKVKIFYSGNIFDLNQNRVIINLFKLETEMRPVSEYERDECDKFIFVDFSQANNARLPKDLRDITPTFVYDHHLESEAAEEKEDQFILIDEVGSTCTLIAELMFHKKFNLEFNSDNEKNRKAATMVALGIYIDTLKLVSASQRDRTAFNMVMSVADKITFAKVADPEKTESYVNNFVTAWKSKRINEDNKDVVVTGIGIVPPGEAGDIALISHELNNIKNFETVYVWCILQDSRKVRISMRSTDVSQTVHDLLGQHFGEEYSGAKFTPIEVFEGGGIIALDFGEFGSFTEPIKNSEFVKKAIENVVDVVITTRIIGEKALKSNNNSFEN